MTDLANVQGRDQMQGPFSMAIPTQVNPAISSQNYIYIYIYIYIYNKIRSSDFRVP